MQHSPPGRTPSVSKLQHHMVQATGMPSRCQEPCAGLTSRQQTLVSRQLSHLAGSSKSACQTSPSDQFMGTPRWTSHLPRRSSEPTTMICCPKLQWYGSFRERRTVAAGVQVHCQLWAMPLQMLSAAHSRVLLMSAVCYLWPEQMLPDTPRCATAFGKETAVSSNAASISLNIWPRMHSLTGILHLHGGT